MYVKLFGTILDSSIWLEDHATVRLWITLLAMADAEGYVRAAQPMLARRARVSKEECEQALKKLSEPDPYSGTQEFDGKRIETTDGGWFLLNYTKYREIRTRQQLMNAKRQKKWRDEH